MAGPYEMISLRTASKIAESSSVRRHSKARFLLSARFKCAVPDFGELMLAMTVLHSLPLDATGESIIINICGSFRI